MNKIIKEIQLDNLIFSLEEGDILITKSEVIVNAANGHLTHGGGIAGVISRAAGDSFQIESNEYVKKHSPVKTGEAISTSAGKLNYRYVIHTVGPVWIDGNHNEPIFLYNAVINSFRLAESLKINSLTFPAVSAGIFGYPLHEALKIYYKAVKDFNEDKPLFLKRINFIHFEQNILNEFISLIF